MDGKIPAGEIKDKSEFLQWFDNFWYHYKVHTIIALFALFVLLVCTLQTCASSSDGGDITVMYAGRCYMTTEQREGVRSVLNAVAPENEDGQSSKYAEIVTYHVMSEQQLKDMAAETDADGRPKYEVNRGYYTQEYENYNNMLLTGEFSICLLDPWLYESLADAGRLKRLADVLGTIPDGMIGECGVRLGDTQLYQYYDAIKVLPEETVICILTPYIFGATSKQEVYAENVEAFKAMVLFEAPQ